MVIIKDLILTILFLCMFGVLLCFMQLHNELRSSVVQNDVTINVQTRIIENSFRITLKQKYQIQNLRIEIVDLREVLLVLQKKEERLNEESKEYKLENKQLERSKKRLLNKIKDLEKEIENGKKMSMPRSY